jgi:hypothetical protein
MGFIRSPSGFMFHGGGGSCPAGTQGDRQDHGTSGAAPNPSAPDAHGLGLSSRARSCKDIHDSRRSAWRAFVQDFGVNYVGDESPSSRGSHGTEQPA